MNLLKLTVLIFSLLTLGASFTVQSAEVTPKQDAKKYPQDTPENTLNSIALALTAEDFGYFTVFLVTPDSTQRTLEKFKTLDAAIADQKTNPAKIAGRKQLIDSIQKALKEPKKTAEKIGDVEAVHFTVSAETLLLLEKQKDGSWCMNPKARAKK